MALILGLDIGHGTIRGALLRTAFRKTEVLRYLQIPMTQTTDQASRAIELADALQGMLRAIDLTPDTIISALAGNHVSLKIIQLPIAAIKHISEVLPLELESVVPFPIEDVVIDYQIIHTSNNQVTLLVAAALRSRITEHLKFLSDSGINPYELAAGAVALEGLAKVIPALQKEGPFLIADIDDYQTDICILQDGMCKSAQTLSIGIAMLPNKAEHLWRGFQRSIASFRAKGAPDIQQVYLSGPGSFTDEINEWLSEKLHMAVSTLPLPEAPMMDDSSLPLFAKALALVGRAISKRKRINLRQGEFAPRRSASVLLRYSTLLSSCVIAILFSIIFSIYSQRSLLTNEHALLQKKLATITKEVFGESLLDMNKVENLMNNSRSNDPLPRFDAFDALDTLSDIISADISHDIKNLRIEIGDEKHEGRFELKGTLGTIEQRDEVALKLEEHECFEEMDKGRTTTSRDKDRINYQLEAVIRCPGDTAPKKGRTSRRSRD